MESIESDRPLELDKRLPQSTRRMKLLRLAALGLNAKRAAEILGIDVQTVRREYRDPEFKKLALMRLEEAFEGVDEKFEGELLSLHDQIQIKGQEAFDTLCHLLGDKDAPSAVRARIAMDILDRNPNTQAGSIVRHGTLIDADQLSKAARVAEEMNGVIPIKKVG